MAKDKDEKAEKAEKVEKAKTPPEAVNTAAEPYPHGNPPDPEDEFEKIHGFRRAPASPAKE